MLNVTTRIAILIALLGCSQSEGPLTVERDGYLEDVAFRRSTLEAALWRPELPYSQSLLSNYGLDDSGWELLPVIRHASAPLTLADAARMQSGKAPELGETFAPDLDGDAAELGAWAFNNVPMRRDGYLSWLLTRPQHWAAVGIDAREDGTVRGLVKYEDSFGKVQVGVTCGLCHAAGEEPGRADRTLDLGLARALYAEARGIDGELFRGWGPGRVDVTDDELDSPTAIPDLFGLAGASYLNHSGSIRVAGKATLAVRFETQIILGHRQEARPDRRLTWALAEYLTLLERPEQEPPSAEETASFEAHCADCHNPERGFAGDLIAADLLDVDPAVALTPERGTGFYKVPSLVGVRDNGPWLHDGSAKTLESILESGHPFGGGLSTTEHDRILSFLNRI